MAKSKRLSRRALADKVCVNEATLRQWNAKGLVGDDDGLFTIDQLLTFCRDQQHLRAARRILEHSESEADALSTVEGLQPARSIIDDSGEGSDLEAVRSVARAARAAALEHLDALVVAAKAAEEAARAHRSQLEHVRAAFASVDEVLVHLTAPATLND